MKSTIVLLLIAVLASGNAGVLVEGLARGRGGVLRSAGRTISLTVDVLARSASEVVREQLLPELPFEVKDAARRAGRVLRLLVRLRLLAPGRAG
jgi:hypothetical protein